MILINIRFQHALAILEVLHRNEDTYVGMGFIAKAIEHTPSGKKNLDAIATDLRLAGIIDGRPGRGGGYKIRDSRVTYLDVLNAVSGYTATEDQYSARGRFNTHLQNILQAQIYN